MCYRRLFFSCKRAPTCNPTELSGFCRHLGVIVGGWVKIVGYLRAEQSGQPTDNRRALTIFSACVIALAIFPALMVELRQINFARSEEHTSELQSRSDLV